MRWLGSSLAMVLLAWATSVAAEDNASTPTPEHADAPSEEAAAWCAPELPTLPDDVCAYVPEADTARAPRTLVIFLHGVIQPNSGWQYAQQRALARAARVNGFSVIMPRGRRGIGPKGMRDWWTWPTSAKAQEQVEQDVLAEWQRARLELEKQTGQKYERVYVFGFSNGAYYSSALALRGKLQVDGYGIFAGGSAPRYLVRTAKRQKQRPPIYVGYGERDKTTRTDAHRLGVRLRALGWPYRMVPRRGVGHTMTDAQLKEAVEFLEKKTSG